MQQTAGTSTQFYDTSSSALHNDLLTVLAKDANAPLEVTDTLTDSSDITILNALKMETDQIWNRWRNSSCSRLISY